MPHSRPDALYDAFISYSHAKDKPLAAAIQSVMQKLGKPWYRRRALRVFRDDTSLAATPELWPTLEKTLDRSRYLIILASPEFARSKWCGMEVAHWLERKSLDSVLIAVTDGELAWEGDDFVFDERAPLPEILKGRFKNEPKWIDFRAWRDMPVASDPRFVDAAANLASAVHDLPKDDLLGQEVQAQKRALRLASSAAVVVALLAAGAGWQWYEASRQRAEAQMQRDHAERNLALARKAADDLVFNLVQKVRSVEGIRADVLRRVLEVAQSVMDDLARGAPNDLEVLKNRAAMLTEFVTTYLALGDVQQAQKSAEEGVALLRRIVAARPAETLALGNLAVGLEKLGDVRSAAGNHEGARAAYDEGVTLVRRTAAAEPNDTERGHDLSALLIKLGDARGQLNDVAGARAAYDEALAGARILVLRDSNNTRLLRLVAGCLNRLGLLLQADKNDRAGALAAYEEGLTITRRLVAASPQDVDLQRDLFVHLTNFGDVQRDGGDRPAALALYEEALTVIRRLAASDPDNAMWQGDIVFVLYRVGQLAEPKRSAAAYREGLAILEALEKAGKLDAARRGWLAEMRSIVAKLPAEN
ncbi:hypothetical protein GJW-30_1_01249 [Variibacter gotjawalensis]|uniref:TIR domain-containing protein n=1 Tax=Variibacter gotjawalensis TaxID=1333996 RepID=A0A0S3PS02_9BRAD|nr:tetratricopeptide repeat protein [Variibacter gotjawalensis]NIK49032.1 tetratricopeptide (TPR) repeat protein [Variibacter gotjawalensis]RZS50888.1 tetratricopeptide repeat protein [Variibacter gotjawalensis]BAT58722.1 hypothetical protein GJW-30_1_01249 [Variibacter gotjawalensis]